MKERELMLPPGLLKKLKQGTLGKEFSDSEDTQITAEIEAIGAFFRDANFRAVAGIPLIKITGEEPPVDRCPCCHRLYKEG